MPSKLRKRLLALQSFKRKRKSRPISVVRKRSKSKKQLL